MKSRNSISFFACFMAAIMLISSLSGLSIAFGTESDEGYKLIQMDDVTVSGQKSNAMYLDEQEEETVDPETVVSIIVGLEEPAVLETYGTLERANSGFQTLTAKGENIRESLLSKQRNVAAAIESKLGIDVEFEYNYTLAFNGFAFDGPYGMIEEIRGMDGVESCEASTIYDIPETKKDENGNLKNFSAADMVYAFDAWNAGIDGEGMLIAVLDTGLDTTHEAFMNAPETLKMTRESLQDILDKNNLQAERCYGEANVDNLYLRDKVPFKFDYANKDTTVEHGQSDHGSHVAGISLADPQVPMLGMEGVYCRGVAYKAQLAVMKVFPDAGGGSAWSDVMAALEDCVYIGADVANLSLGSPLGFPSIDNTYAKVYNTLDENGVIVACAAGNDYSSAYDSTWGTDMATTENLDSSMVGSPSTYTESLSVAAIYNNKIFYSDYVQIAGEKFGYSDTAKSNGNRPDLLIKEKLKGQTLDMVAVPGLGNDSDYAGIDVTGKVALVSRGDITFAEKEMYAANHGAAAIVVYDNVDSTTLINMKIDNPTIPAIFIYRSAGLLAIDSIANGDGKIYVSDGTGMITDAANAATPTDFSSWGPLANLTIKPEISAPGGNIMSSVDPNIGGDGKDYANYSGTSMATPNISGCIALIRQYVNKTFPDYSYQQKTDMVNILLMCTANPVVDAKGTEYGVRRQGAGMANVIGAITTKAYLTSSQNASTNERPKIEVGDDPQRTGVYTLNFKITNFGDKTLSYDIAPSMTTADYEWIDQGDRATNVIKGNNMDVTGMMTYTTNYENNRVTVAAGETKDITVKMTVNDDFRKLCSEVFKFGAYVEGYCYLNGVADSEGSIPTRLNICYLGYYGGWSEVPVIDGGFYYDKPENDLSCMAYPNTAASKVRSNVYLGIGMNPYIPEGSDEEANFEFLMDRGSISPANQDKYYDAVDFFVTGIMRNLRKFYYTIYDAQTGEVYWEKNSGSGTRKNADTSMAGFITPYGVSANKMKAWAGGDTTEGTTAIIRCGGEAYYEKWDDSQATRAYWEVSVTLDNTAPTVVDSWSEGTTVYVKVTDNHYAAYAGVFSTTDLDNPVAATYIAEKERGAETTIAVDMSQLETAYLLLGDYACNEVQYMISKSGAVYTPTPDAPETDDTYYAPVYEMEAGETYLITATGSFMNDDSVYALTNVAAQPYSIRLQGAQIEVDNQYVTGGSKLAAMEWKYNADGSVQNVESGKYLGLTQYGDAYWLGMNDSSDVKWTFDGRSFSHNSSLTTSTHLIYFTTIENADTAAFDVFDPAQSSSKISVFKKVVKEKQVQASLSANITEADGKLTVGIDITKNPNAASGMVTINYNANYLEYAKAKAGKDVDGVFVQPNDAVPGKLIIAFAASDAMCPDGGEILTADFNVKADKGTLVIIDLVVNELLADDTSTNISANATGASYVIGGGSVEPTPTQAPTPTPTATQAPTPTPTATQAPTPTPTQEPTPTQIPEDAVKFTLSYEGETDKVITLKLSVDQKSEIASGVYVITYEADKVDFLKHKAGEVLDGFFTMVNSADAGIVRVAFAGTEEFQDEGGEVCTITFQVKDSVENGTKIDFGVELPELLKGDSTTKVTGAGIGCSCYAGGQAPVDPTEEPTPTQAPTPTPTQAPTPTPTQAPTPTPTQAPTPTPTQAPTPTPTQAPTPTPTQAPTPTPTQAPTPTPTQAPTPTPTTAPTATPTTAPTTAPTAAPTQQPSPTPTTPPTPPITGAQAAPYTAIILAMVGIVGMGYFFLRRKEEM